jgi:hypothetical protein
MYDIKPDSRWVPILSYTHPVTGADATTLSTSAIVEAEVTNMRVIKNRSLCSRHLDIAYPSRMPFYLYSTGHEIHIDHVIVQEPNAQLSVGEVTVELLEGSKSAFVSGLKDGFIAVADTIPEHLMQPFTSDRLKHFFYPGAKFDVSVYLDQKAVQSHGADFCAQLNEPIARATITLGANIFADTYMVNIDAPVVLSQSPKKKLAIPETTPISQDHPLFRGYAPSGPIGRYISTRNTQSWREVWDRALAGRRFADDGSQTENLSASDSESDDYCASPVALRHPPIPLFKD